MDAVFCSFIQYPHHKWIRYRTRLNNFRLEAPKVSQVQGLADGCGACFDEWQGLKAKVALILVTVAAVVPDLAVLCKLESRIARGRARDAH